MAHRGDSESVEPQHSQPVLCAAGCGFFANAGCDSLCSKCGKQKQAEAEALPAVKALLQSRAEEEPSGTSTSTSSQPIAAAADAPPPQKAPTRCQLDVCKKKVGLTGFKCKCGLVFCGQHRYAEVHKCAFDYKAAERVKLAENNPLVVGDKVNKI